MVPVLVQGAEMPPPAQLPEELSALGRRNAIELTDAGWSRDTDHLIATLRERLPASERRRRERRGFRVAVAALVLMCTGGAVAALALSGGSDDADRGKPKLEVKGTAPVAGEPDLRGGHRRKGVGRPAGG